MEFTARSSQRLKVDVALGNMKIDRNRSSALLVSPNEAWLALVGEQGVSDRFIVEENAVWVIPSIGSFPSGRTFSEYLEELKPRLFKCELNRFDLHSHFPDDEVTSSLFDQFFRIEIRDHVTLIEAL